jgi:hypothetical protein
MWGWMSNKLWRYFWRFSEEQGDFGGKSAIIYFTRMGVFSGKRRPRVGVPAKNLRPWDWSHEGEREGEPQGSLWLKLGAAMSSGRWG